MCVCVCVMRGRVLVVLVMGAGCAANPNRRDAGGGVCACVGWEGLKGGGGVCKDVRGVWGGVERGCRAQHGLGVVGVQLGITHALPLYFQRLAGLWCKDKAFRLHTVHQATVT